MDDEFRVFSPKSFTNILNTTTITLNKIQRDIMFIQNTTLNIFFCAKCIYFYYQQLFSVCNFIICYSNSIMYICVICILLSMNGKTKLNTKFTQAEKAFAINNIIMWLNAEPRQTFFTSYMYISYNICTIIYINYVEQRKNKH